MTEKNKKKLDAKKQRVFIHMNTATVTHKDKKHPSRKELKKRLDKFGY